MDLVLPCLDEAAALAWVLPRVPPGVRAIVVDNGSTDGSADVAQGLGALVVHESARGFGSACHAGLLAATADVVAFMDADGSLDPRQLERVLGPLRTGADLVLGRRRPTSGCGVALAPPARQPRARRPAGAPDRDAPARSRAHACRAPDGPARARAA